MALKPALLAAQNVGVHPIEEVRTDDVLSLINLGRLPENWEPRNKKT